MPLTDDHPALGAEPLSHRLAADLEPSAAALARLNSALMSHPLTPAWAYRARLDAVRRQAASTARRSTPGTSPL